MPRKTKQNDITSPELLRQVNPDNMRLKQDFLDYLKSVQRSPKTIAGYDNDIDIFWVWNLKYNNNKFFPKITKRDYAAYQNWLINENGNSPARVRRLKSAISSMSNFVSNILDDEDDFKDFRSVVRKIENPAMQQVRKKTVWSDEALDELLDKLAESGKHKKACALALAMCSGRRKAELCRFRVDDFKNEKIYKETIELVAYLCKLYNLDPHGTVTHCGVKNVPVILCHQDSYQYGLGCNHADVTHWFPLHGKSMQTVRDDVAALLAGTNTNNEEDDDMDVVRFKELWNELRKELQDNDCGSWSEEDRAWAISNGLVVGNGTVINGEPNYMWADFTTREQMVTLLHREELRIMKLVEQVVGKAVEQAVLKALSK